MKYFLLVLLFAFSILQAQEVILAENFENGIPSQWEVKSNQNKRNWYAKTYQNSHYLSMSAFAGKGKPGYDVKAALHTPLLDLTQKKCKLRFALADAYSNGQPLQVYLTSEKFELIKKLNDDYWKDLVNNQGKYDNQYEATEWIPLPQINQAYRISFVYESKQENKIVTTIIQLNEVDVWCVQK